VLWKDKQNIYVVICETDKPSSSGTAAEITSLAQSVAQRLYDGGNGTINAEVTGRTTQIEVNADGGDMGSELFSAYCCHFRSVSHYIDTVFAIDIKVDFVAT
jgi:hypothetical protein